MGFSCCSYTSINLVFWVLLFNLSFSHLASSKPPLCHDDERYALLQFKESLTINEATYVSAYSFAYPKVSYWKADEENGNCCSWEGITCSEHTGHVVRLDLTSSFLYGSINSNSSLFQLVHLEWLSLADNNFDDSKIPSRIMNLSRLSYLDLSYSLFSGQIPSEILELSNLVFLNVSYNHLKHQNWGLLGSLAEALTNLKILDLSGVNISSSIPHSLANLSSLTYLSLEECGLQGEILSEFFRLPNLQFLNVGNNEDFAVYLPEFGKNSSLEELRLGRTRFCGRILNSLDNLKSLSYLDMEECNLSGSIPSSLSNLTRIRFLSSAENILSGELSSLGNLGSLEELDLSRNKLTGPIPYSLMNLNKLISLYLSNNQLTGHIPFEIKNLTQLSDLSLGSNRLEGPIPSSLFELKNLQRLYLSSNNLSGTLDLNKFLSKLKNLESLLLSSNNLSLLTNSTVYTYSQKFDTIDLRSCNLNEFPYFLQKQEQLSYLDLSSNKIAGHIPGWLLNMSIDSLYHLNLSHNQLTGFHQHPVVGLD